MSTNLKPEFISPFSSRVRHGVSNRRSSLVRNCIFAALTGIVSATSAHAAEQQAIPGWQSILGLQLKTEFNCDFDKVLFDREVEVAGKMSLEGRARCLDGREFDFSRAAEHEKFDVRLCTPTVC
ncbi:MAG: hypothetical protein KDJ45_07430 [Hyphomicrobiaceae bacterium]|nr:hypothetical protein [Hyphomicrobiaceae bacterium]